MSRQDVREAFKVALSAVDGIRGFAARPSVFKAGDAWPQWRGSEYAGGHAYTDTWVVLVIMPESDDITADRFADLHADAITDALRPIMFVGQIDPAEIPADGNHGAIRALAFTGRNP